MQASKPWKAMLVGPSLKVILSELYPVFIFYGVYAFVVYLYDWLQPFKPMSPGLANLIQFGTGPFSFIEATPPYSSSVAAGLYNNFLFVAMLMVLLAMYNLTFSNRLRHSLSLPRVFGAGVAGTYAVSGVIWHMTGEPSTGTSIIGFTMAAALAAASATDLSGQLRRIFTGRQKVIEYGKAYVFLIALGIALLIALRSYILANSSYPLHLAGGAVSGVVVYAWARKKDKPTPKSI